MPPSMYEYFRGADIRWAAGNTDDTRKYAAELTALLRLLTAGYGTNAKCRHSPLMSGYWGEADLMQAPG
jgi:hypothetical protein